MSQTSRRRRQVRRMAEARAERRRAAEGGPRPAHRIVFDVQPRQWLGMAPRRSRRLPTISLERVLVLREENAKLPPRKPELGVSPDSGLMRALTYPGMRRADRRLLLAAVQAVGKPRGARLQKRFAARAAEIGLQVA